MTTSSISLLKAQSDCAASYDILAQTLGQYFDALRVFDADIAALQTWQGVYSSGYKKTVAKCTGGGENNPRFNHSCDHYTRMAALAPDGKTITAPNAPKLDFACTVCSQNINISDVKSGAFANALSQQQTCIANTGTQVMNSYSAATKSAVDTAAVVASGLSSVQTLISQMQGYGTQIDAMLATITTASVADDALTASFNSISASHNGDYTNAISALTTLAGKTSDRSIAPFTASRDEMKKIIESTDASFAAAAKSIKDNGFLAAMNAAISSLTAAAAVVLAAEATAAGLDAHFQSAATKITAKIAAIGEANAAAVAAAIVEISDAGSMADEIAGIARKSMVTADNIKANASALVVSAATSVEGGVKDIAPYVSQMKELQAQIAAVISSLDAANVKSAAVAATLSKARTINSTNAGVISALVASSEKQGAAATILATAMITAAAGKTAVEGSLAALPQVAAEGAGGAAVKTDETKVDAGADADATAPSTTTIIFAIVLILFIISAIVAAFLILRRRSPTGAGVLRPVEMF